jgi:hypothetical protein
VATFSQSFFTSRKNNANGQEKIGEVGRLWYEPETNTIRVSDGATPGGIIVGGNGGGNGYVGSRGFVGSQGVTGFVGSRGITGYTGSVGATGADALWNFTGAYSGGIAYAVGDVATYAGETWYRLNANGGNTGDTPAEGTFWTLISAQGVDGYDGSQGDIGFVGSQGADGAAVEKGFTGSQGAGYVGSRGDLGFTGSQGNLGYVGSQGDLGYSGSQGYAGSKGDTGFVGSLGVAGGINYAVTNSGASSYTIAGTTNPTLTLIKGFTYYFNVSAIGHPFWIKTTQTTGTGSSYTNGVTNNGVDSGTVTFTVPFNAPDTLYYICQYHESMVGILNTVDSIKGYTGSDGIGYTGSAYSFNTSTLVAQAVTSISVSNKYVEITTSTSAVVGQKYIVDTSNVSITVTLPGSGTIGDEITIIDGSGNASTHAIILDRNGGKIQGIASNMNVTTDRAAFTLVYYNSANGWILTNV